MPITTLEQLQQHFAPPQQLVLDKVVSGLDPHTEAFLSQCPFYVLSTQNTRGQIDLSPRGGQPGLIKIANSHTLWLPEYAGNDRIDTLKNLLHSPQIGLIALLPGMGETLRIKGKARILKPEEIPEATSFQGTPKVIIELTIEQLYFQCAMALKLSKLWQGDYQINRSDFPSIYQIIADQAQTEKAKQSQTTK